MRAAHSSTSGRGVVLSRGDLCLGWRSLSRAGGPHPTGMHSCLLDCHVLVINEQLISASTRAVHVLLECILVYPTLISVPERAVHILLECILVYSTLISVPERAVHILLECILVYSTLISVPERAVHILLECILVYPTLISVPERAVHVLLECILVYPTLISVPERAVHILLECILVYPTLISVPERAVHILLECILVYPTLISVPERAVRILPGMHSCLSYIRLSLNEQLISVLTGVILITSSYPGWIKSPHVVTLGILKILDLDSLTIFGGEGGYSGVNFGHSKSEVFRRGGVLSAKSKLKVPRSA